MATVTVQYLGDYSGLVVLSTVGPSVFTALLLQVREVDRHRQVLDLVQAEIGSHYCRQVLHQVQLVAATTAPLRPPGRLPTRKQHHRYYFNLCCNNSGGAVGAAHRCLNHTSLNLHEDQSPDLIQNYTVNY